jgi:nucleoside 2-deoxyribosyltransferase
VIYLAQPYTSPHLEVMHERYEAALAFVAHISRKNQCIYSPVVHYHPVAVYHDLPRAFDFWRPLNEHMIDLADSLYVLQLEGWRESFGTAAEIAYAKSLGKPVVYVDDVRG